MKDFMLL
jgi:hypothetical protein